MDYFKLSKDYAYHRGEKDVVVASLLLEDDFFLKISGPASDVIPLLEREITYEDIVEYLLKNHSVLSREIIDNNLPKMLKYLTDTGICQKTILQKLTRGPLKSTSVEV